MTEFSEWIYRTSGDIEGELRAAYERDDKEWLLEQAVQYPQEYLAAADVIGVVMHETTRMWLKEQAEWGHWRADREKRLHPPEPIAPKSAVAQTNSQPRERCRDCGDILPPYRVSKWCTRCNKVRTQAAADARRNRPQAPRVYHCLACRTNIPDPDLGPRLCARCAVERYVEQPSEDDGVMRRNTGTWPHLAFYTNRRGESVVKGRILPHPRYGESRLDRLGDTPEIDD